MIKNRYAAKTLVKHILCDCKCIFNSTPCNSHQTWNNKTCQCECKNCCWWFKNCVMKLCVIDIVSNKKINTIATNMSINCHSNKVRCKIDCYILHTVLLAIILLLVITIICYHCVKLKSKLKQSYCRANNIKWKIINFKKFVLKTVRVNIW